MFFDEFAQLSACAGTSFKWLLIELADEYFWVNALLAAQRAICADGFRYCNPDRTCA
jgi:hypothetical protein